MFRDHAVGIAPTTSGMPRRWLFVVFAALLLLGGSGWLVPEDAAAGQAGMVVVDGAPLFADHDDHTVIEWMEEGTRVDFFYGPHNWMYEIRYYGTVGWTWVENIALDGEGTGGSTWSDESSESEDASWDADATGGERWIDVNRSNGAVTLYEGNTPLYVFWGSLSRSQGEDFYATASGTYYVYNKIEPLTYTPYADNYFTHWVGFDPERKNGFHSYVKYADGTVTPNGGGFSAGCVMLPTDQAAIVFDFAYVGMRVEVHW